MHKKIMIRDKKQKYTVALTRRESQCIAYALQGQDMLRIAQILGVSERTVQFYFTNIQKKVDLPNLT